MRVLDQDKQLFVHVKIMPMDVVLRVSWVDFRSSAIYMYITELAGTLYEDNPMVVKSHFHGIVHVWAFVMLFPQDWNYKTTYFTVQAYPKNLKFLIRKGGVFIYFITSSTFNIMCSYCYADQLYIYIRGVHITWILIFGNF